MKFKRIVPSSDGKLTAAVYFDDRNHIIYFHIEGTTDVPEIVAIKNSRYEEICDSIDRETGEKYPSFLKLAVECGVKIPLSQTFAFISRHEPTDEQHKLAALQGIKLDHVGDRDAFTINPHEFVDYDGVIVVHPAAALHLCALYTVGVFANGNRAAEGEKPQFFAKSLHLFDRRD